MDILDRISICAAVLLVTASAALIFNNAGQPKPPRIIPAGELEMKNNSAELAARTRTIRALIEGDNLAKAELLVQELVRTYPYEGEPRMLMGDILSRKQKIIESVLEYKEAVELNPDYLDKKTPLFQGRKLKVAVNEALNEVEKEMRLGSGERMKEIRKSIYYLQRRIAGSCG